MSESDPTLSVDGPIGEVLHEDRLRALDGAPLLRFLAPRRWFGGKGGGVVDVRVRDVIPLFPGTAVARLVVERSDREPSIYQLPLAVPATAAPRAIIANVESPAGNAVLVDAMEDLEFLSELGRAFADGRRFAAGETRWSVSRAERAFERPRPVGAEQSNTSVFYGDEAILKLYRRLVVGEHPDVEIGEFLTARGFEHVPKLFGTMAFEDADGARSVAGMIQELVVSDGDAWSAALAAARAGDDFAPRARALGSVTRALHEALASDSQSPAFAPRPLDPAEVERVGERVRAQIARTVELLERRLASPPPSWTPLRGRLSTLIARRRDADVLCGRSVETFAAAPGAAIRHHGDYHLGQVLVGREGRLVIVDFEGEPARPLSERRARASALRDVAGMLRSFSYAARVGAADNAAARWEDSARERFLGAYVGSGRSADFLPPRQESLDAGLALFELEKVFYELEYEIDNRPEWVGVPLAGVERLLTVPR